MANNVEIVVVGKDKASGPLHKVSSGLQGVGKAGGSVGGVLSGVGGAMVSLGATATRVAAGGIAAMGVGLTAIGGASVKTAATFEQQLSGIEAVLMPTGDAMDRLSRLALRLGKDTSFGASDAAAGLEMLAKNSLDANQILGGAADAMLDLAAATGLKGQAGLSNAADIATDAMAQFTIEAADMADAVSGIAGVTVNSKFDIDDYRLALAQAGGVAGSVGVSFDDFNTTIAGIAPLFASGSDAGTSFKTFLQRLNPASEEAAALMADLGLEFFNADGSMKDMAEIAGILQTGLAGLSEEQRNNALSTIFGTDAMRAAVGLAELGETEFRELAGSIGEIDAAEQAGIRLDNLSGDMEQLRGSLETASIQLGTAFLPLMRTLVQRATEFVNTHFIDRDWTPLVDGAVVAVNALSGLIYNIGLWIDRVREADGSIARFIEKLSEFANMVRDHAVTAFQTLLEYVQTNLPIWIENLMQWGAAFLDWLIVAVPKFLEQLAEWRKQLIDYLLTSLPDWIDALAEWSFVFLDWIIEAAPKMLKFVIDATLDMIALIIDKAPAVIEALAQWAAALVDWVIDAAPGLADELLVLAGDILQFLYEQVPKIAAQLGEWIPVMLAWVGETIPKLIIALGELVGRVYTWMAEQAPDLIKNLGAWSQAFIDWAWDDGLPALGNALVNIAGSLWNDIRERWNNAFAAGSIGRAMIDGIKQGFLDAWDGFTEFFVGKFEELRTMVPEWMGGTGDEAAPMPEWGSSGGGSGGSWGTGGGNGVDQATLSEWQRIIQDTSLPDGHRRLYNERYANATGVRLSAPGLADGGIVNRGGMALIGERGPELLNLPAGAAVSPLPQQAPNVTVNVHVQGSVTAERDLAMTVRTEFQRYLQNNPRLGF